MSEARQDRSRRKFTAGVLEQFAASIGSLAAGVLVASVVAPLVAAVVSPAHSSGTTLTFIAVAGVLGGLALLCAAAYAKGWAKQVDDDHITVNSPGNDG